MFRDFGWFEIAVIALFIGLYTLYGFRLARIGSALQTPFHNMFIKLSVRMVIFALVIFALLGPSYGDSKREIKSVGKDIMVCVDLSRSMDAFDIQPTRLEKVKFELKKIADAFNSDRIGVIIFSSEAFVQCPLTYDHNALNLFIETMNSSLVPAAGTDFAPPLRLALQKLNDQEGPSTQQKSKVIILISDGEDFGEETHDILKDVEEKEIKLFTLGVGTKEGGKIHAGRALKTDRNGNTVITKLNSAALKGLASDTGGEYFEINGSRNDVPRLISTINRIEGEMRDAKTVDVSANRYFYFLLAAFVLLSVDVLLNVKTVQL